MSIADRKEREQEKKRQLILESAYSLFKEKGFEFTTVDEIAARAEIGKGTVYSYYKSKEEIYVKIIEFELDILMERLKRAVSPSSSAEEALNNLYDAYVGFYKEYSGYLGSFLGKEIGKDKNAIRLGDLITGLKTRSFERQSLISSVLERGIANGEFIPFDIERVTKIFSSLIIGLIAECEVAQIEEDLSNYKGAVFTIFLNGIKKK